MVILHVSNLIWFHGMVAMCTDENKKWVVEMYIFPFFTSLEPQNT